MRRDFVHIFAVVEVASRRALAHRISITMKASLFVEAREEAAARQYEQEFFDTDPGSPFSSQEFTSVPTVRDASIRMDGKSAACNDGIVEPLRLSNKYEKV